MSKKHEVGANLADHPQQGRCPDLATEQQVKAEEWASKHAFALPQEFLQFDSGSFIQIYHHSVGNCIPATVGAHLVWDGMVSPADSAKSPAQKYLVPGIYRISFDETLVMKYRLDGQDGKLLIANIPDWVMLTAVKQTSHRGIIIGSKHAYYMHGRRSPEKPHLEIQKCEGESDVLNCIGNVVY